MKLDEKCHFGEDDIIKYSAFTCLSNLCQYRICFDWHDHVTNSYYHGFSSTCSATLKNILQRLSPSNMFSNLEECWRFERVVQQFGIFKTIKEILDFDQVHVVKHANSDPIKSNLIAFLIARRRKTPYDLKTCT